MKKFYISKEERKLIASTPSRECWICDLFSNNVRKNKNGYFIPEKILSDDGLVEHIEQIVRREVSFST